MWKLAVTPVCQRHSFLDHKIGYRTVDECACTCAVHFVHVLKRKKNVSSFSYAVLQNAECKASFGEKNEMLLP